MWLRAKSSVAYVLACVAVVAFAFAAISLNDVAGFVLILLPVALLVAALFPEHAYRLIAGVGLLLVLVVASISVWNNAVVARNDIEAITSSAQFDLFNPWEGRIAIVRTSSTDTCGLYLGEANGLGVLVVRAQAPGEKRRTMRFPLSSVVLVVRPEAAAC
jgi:hypothetical protein